MQPLRPVLPPWFFAALFVWSAALLSAATPEFRSPEQLGPGEVVFRIYAPDAKVVSVQGLRRRPPVPMERGNDGIWTATVTDLPADIYSYTFNVDGVVVLDAHNPNLKKWTTSESAVEVTGATPTVYSLSNVPHGTVHRHVYFSKAANRLVSLQVYTPPGYEEQSRSRYPMIVLCHGTGDDETAWTENGRAHLVADNLIARGAMKKAVIVMPYGHPIPLPLARPADYPDRNLVPMEEAIISEVLPFVERIYSVSRNADDRAIAGLSMGGGHAVVIGLSHPDIFHWVGGFSTSVPLATSFDRRFAPWVKAQQDKRHSPRLLWLGIGRDDALLERNEKLTTWLRANNVPFVWKLTDGGHEWSLWREFFADFAQLVFQPATRH